VRNPQIEPATRLRGGELLLGPRRIRKMPPLSAQRPPYDSVSRMAWRPRGAPATISAARSRSISTLPP
jgi:hypothetical protein